MLDVAAGLLDAEAEQGAERLARRGADPVRVAAAGVQSGTGPPFGLGRQSDQLVLQLERAELEERALVGSGGGRLSRLRAMVRSPLGLTTDSMMMIMPQIVSSVLPTA